MHWDVNEVIRIQLATSHVDYAIRIPITKICANNPSRSSEQISILFFSYANMAEHLNKGHDCSGAGDRFTKYNLIK